METLSLSSNTLSMQENKNTKWTNEQNTWFESALAIFDTDTPDRWSNVAALVPGKSEIDVKNQYEKLKADINEIEADMVPDPGYFTSSFEDHSFSIFGKRPRSCDQERRKGVPWTEEEHRRFLVGLQVHGKGDWRSISRNFVMTKTPTQVASHAQKYYARQHSDGKEKRRPSIHDITIINHPDNSERSPPSINKPTGLPKDMLHWNNPSDETVTSMAYPFEIAKMNKNVRVYNSGLRLQPTRYQVQG
ncbi:transcription factor DIVARICATA [Lactuca sativa]|nr:transcription factor DIVARICATA [Lactuca sativa]